MDEIELPLLQERYSHHSLKGCSSEQRSHSMAWRLLRRLCFGRLVEKQPNPTIVFGVLASPRLR